MNANDARYFEDYFNSRGADATWGKKTRSAPANIAKGDEVVLALAKQYVPIGKDGFGYAAGINADGTINFGGWFSAYLKVRKMPKDCGVPFIDAVSKDGMVLAGASVVNENGLKVYAKDIIVSPGLVKGLCLTLAPKSLHLEIMWHDLPVSEAEILPCPSGLGKHYIDNIKMSFPRVETETDVDVTAKFLKFALSASNFTFANISKVAVQGLHQQDMPAIGNVFGEVIASKTIYANPLITFVSDGNKVVRYVRDITEEFVSQCKSYDNNFAEPQRSKKGASVHEALYVGQIACGRFGSEFLGDYLAGSQITLPGGVASYGATFEETVLNCIRSLSSVASKVENMSAEERNKVLYGNEEEEENNANVATDATSSDSKTSEGVAGGEEPDIEDDEEDFVGDEPLSEKDATIKANVEAVLSMWDVLYNEDTKDPASFKYVGVIPESTSTMMRFYRRPTMKRWDGYENPFMPIGNSTFGVTSLELGDFSRVMKNLWDSLATAYSQSGSSSKDFVRGFGLQRALPQNVNDFEWLKASVSKENGFPTVSWFPFIHAALCMHYAPWDYAKKSAKPYSSWDALRKHLEKWLTGIFMDAYELPTCDRVTLEALRVALMRHLVLRGGSKTFVFSCFWDSAVQMTNVSLGEYFRAEKISIAKERTTEDMKAANTFVECEMDIHRIGRFEGTFTPDLNAYLGETLLGYDVLQNYLKKSGGKLSKNKVPMGVDFKGKPVTINLNGGQQVFPAIIRAGGRSGKGVLTQLLMINLLGCGYPFVYLDAKPEMALTWAQFGRDHGVKTLGADPTMSYKSFIPMEMSEAQPLNPCMNAVLNSVEFADFKNLIYWGKLVHLVGGYMQARLKRESDHIFATDNFFVIADEINALTKALQNFYSRIPAKPEVAIQYKAARDAALKEYKVKNPKATSLPNDTSITVDDIGTFTVGEWNKTVGITCDGSPITKQLKAMACALGNLLASSTTDAPKAHLFSILIGQMGAVELGSFPDGIKRTAQMLRSTPLSMALYGREWETGIKEDDFAPVVQNLREAPNSQLAFTAGIFIYRKDKSSEFETIKTGVVLAENDIDTTQQDESGSWSGAPKPDLTEKLLNNIKDAAGAKDEKKGALASKAFAETKLRVTESLKAELDRVGMPCEVGQPNPLVTFDGLMDYTAKLTGSSPNKVIDDFYAELCKLLTMTGSGFTDVYTYLSDISAMYTKEQFALAIQQGARPLTTSSTEDGDEEDDARFGNTHIDLDDEGGEQPIVSGTTPTAFNVPVNETPVNPARAAATAPVDASFGRPIPTWERAQARAEEMARAEAESAGDAYEEEEEVDVEYRGTAGFEGVTEDEMGAFGGDTDEETPKAEKPIESAGEETPKAEKSVESASGEAPTPKTAERTTPAAPVCGTKGASGRYAGGHSPYAENPDGTVTVEAPGGRVDGYYTAAETVQTLSRLYDDDKARKLAQTPKGRALMALESMQTLVKMLEDKTGLNRAMIKSVTFADNCLFVRDACVIGGKPDAYDLYDYVDMKNFLKTMSGLTVLQMDRNAYFHLIIRPGYSAQDAFLFSQTLQTFQFDKCQLLRDGRIIGNAPDAVKDSFIADFDRVATDNAIPTSKSKAFSGSFLSRAFREVNLLHTPEYQEKRARLTKLRRDLYGKKAEQFIQEDRPISGFFSAVRFWFLDHKLAKLQAKL